MALDELQFQIDGPPQRQLANLLHQTSRLLDSLQQDPDYRELFFSEMYGAMRDAWPTTRERISAYMQIVLEADIEPLQEHGLTEVELWFKLYVLDFHGRRFTSQFRESTLPVRRKLGKRLLDAIDKVLKSLFSAVPGGGAIGEYKDICETIIPDNE